MAKGGTGLDPEGLSRLRAEQLKAIEETNERIAKLESFMDDYKDLQSRLGTFSERISHDIMVPFGKFAFMPGQLIHTNEILVLLGDDWFCERSTKQAIEIAGRRVDALGVQIDKLKQQRGLLEPRLDFTAELGGLVGNTEELFEIQEEYDEEQESEWQAQHRKNVRAYKKQQRENKLREDQAGEQKDGVTTETAEEDDALWRRLDELELQEHRNREMSRDLKEGAFPTSTHPNFQNENSKLGIPDIKSSQGNKPGVRWKDQEAEDESSSREDDEYDEDYDSDDEYEEEESNSPGKPTTISFTHTAMSENSQEGTEDSVENTSTITSPTDIYRQFVKPVLDKPRSILRTPSSEFPDTPQEKVVKQKLPHVVKDIRDLNPDLPEAFTGKIVEKAAANQSPQNTTTANQNPLDSVPGSSVSMATDEPPKRVSRFKAQRMKKGS